MTTRTIKTTVTFKRPFSLSGFDGEQPAGTYSVETDEELEGVSAYRQMATMMQIEPASLHPGASFKSQSSIRNSSRRPLPWMQPTARHTISPRRGER